MSAAALIAAILSLSQDVFGWHLGIDELLFVDRASSDRPGRVPVATAVLIGLVGMAVTQFERESLGRVTSQVLGLITPVAALITLCGYLYSADEGQLAQVFQNLIGNAIKFRSEAPPHVVIAAKLSDGYWVFSVKDNGIGMEMQYADRVFQMFQRLHQSDEYEGSGIGLAITKRVVERHGGRVWFESQPGAGSTFFFTMLPATVQDSAGR